MKGKEKEGERGEIKTQGYLRLRIHHKNRHLASLSLALLLLGAPDDSTGGTSQWSLARRRLEAH
ncbi:hypothetical protein CCMA1212_002590 [Trichoderma ghanense]|uniref:Uncharacterized protein n=1 Tax=Trichoderma ghanense TaxID=65468 RepID=A0ABY2HBN7_9HYPO